MTDISIPNISILTATDQRDSAAGADGLLKPERAVIADYNFNDGDTSAMVKNGFAWNETSIPIITPSGATEDGISTSYPAAPNPWDSGATFGEHRFSFNEITEFWIKQRVFIPTNYFHRACMPITITGDITAWQTGDAILAGDGTSTATVYSKDGQNVWLLFAQNPTIGAGVWTANITNVTRSSTLPAVKGSFMQHNNKLLSLWCDDYSAKGLSPTIVFELKANRIDGGSVIYYHFGADYDVVGTLPNSTSEEVPLIEASDFGTYIDLEYHVKMATSESAENGVIELWVRKEGAGSYTKLFSQANAMIGSRAAGLAWDKTARFAAVSNLTLSGLYVHDGKTILNGDRIFTSVQTDPKENGIYIASAGAWTRATDYDTASEIIGHGVTVSEASTGISAGSGFVCQNRTGTLIVGTNDIMLKKRTGTVGVNVSGNAKFRNGYIHGAANSGFAEVTTFADSRIILSAATIDGVV